MNLKNTISLIVLSGLILSGVNLNAANKKKDAGNSNPQSVVDSRYVMRDNLFGKAILSGGLSSGAKYGSGFGFVGMFDYRIADQFSIGAQAKVYLNESSFSENRNAIVGVRANYHIIKEDRIGINNWDWYIGADLGLDINGPVVKNGESPEGIFAVHTGLRYKLNYRWLAFTEVGTRNASIGLAIMF